MKKITLMFFAIFALTFSWQGNAQLSEGFESGLVSLTNEAGNDVDWTISTSYFSEGIQSAHNDYGNSENNSLVSGPLDISGMIVPILYFDQIAKTEGGYDFCYVEVSTDGTNWTTLGTYDEDSYSDWGTGYETPTNDWWMTEEIDLTSYISASTYIRFRLESDTSAARYGWLLDNVHITEQPMDTPDWYNIQWLYDNDNAVGSNTSLTTDAWVSATAYAQVYEPGLTEAAGQGAGIECWIGANATDTDPSAWPEDSWEVATYFGDSGNNDEYTFDTTLNFSGTVYVAARWRLNGGPYVYGGYNGPWDGTTNNNIELIVNPVVANDNCDSAIPLTVNADLACGVVTSGTTVQATASPQTDDVTGTPDNDVWYSFVATGSAHRIELLNIVAVVGTSTDMGMALYDATGGCGALVLVDDSDPNAFTVGGLTPGTTYYLRVYGWSASNTAQTTFDVCVGTPPPPPSNDECLGADTITESLDNSCANAVSGTTASATNSADYSCSSSYNDVWYEFTPATTGPYYIERTLTSGTSTTYLSIWSGTCGSLTQVNSSCYSDSLYESLTAGTTYYISVATTNSGSVDFDLCVYPAPTGSVCDDPIVVGALPYNTTDDTVDYGDDYSSSPGSTGCGTTNNYLNGDDVVYAYTATSDTSINIAMSSISDTYSGVFVYTDCADIGTACVAGFGNGSSTADYNFDVDVTNGTTYYIVISTWSTPQSTAYTLDITENTCTSATVSYSLVNDCSNSGGFLIDVEITDMGTATALTLSDDQGSATQPATAIGTYQFGPYPSGTDVVITVADDNDINCSQSSSTLSFYCPPANDDCAGAIAIIVDEGYCDGTNTNGDNSGATDSGLGEASCFNYGLNDVWFSFTVPAGTATVDISTDFTGGTLIDSEIAVYSGVCGALVEEDCDNDSGTTELSNGFSWNSLIEDFAVTVGETYYVRVSGYLDIRIGSFCLDISTNQTLSIGSEELQSFSFYPNPVTDTFIIKAQKTIEAVSVYNMLGQEVMKAQPNTVDGILDMSNLSNGSYFVKVTIEGVSETIRVIKQ